MKSDHGWAELINLCDTLANNSNDIEKILDVDKALSMTPSFNDENTGTITNISNPNLEMLASKATPNPANDYFFLEIGGYDGMERNVSIFNLNGILVYQDVMSKNKFIHTYDWAAGMYLIKVYNSFLKIVIN